ncbi:hypothetical protein ACGGAQ_03540 [Micromonospora sp. NPDC047557]|uniref:hypothetical protein n=1 Tax=Micromonospora sp. NPDC047557 TaxID=3364250 RepID=UPI003719341D
MTRAEAAPISPKVSARLSLLPDRPTGTVCDLDTAAETQVDHRPLTAVVGGLHVGG